MKLTRRGIILGAVGSVVAPAVARSEVRVEGGLAFGSSWRITLDGSVPLARLRPLVEGVIAEVDGQMSPYRAGSDLSVFNATPSRGWQSMPPALCHVAGEALRMATLTGGAFDPTVGPIVSRYGFGPIKGGLGSFLGVDVQPRSLRKAAPGLTLDLCGIAKGYALDRITDALARAGVVDALAEVGGEVKALGRHPDGRPWSVAIADPRAKSFAVQRIVAPGRLALATSGHASNGLSGPIATSHIIDPRRGRPTSADTLSVSVLAPTAMQADALATGLCALGSQEAVALARRLGIAALFVGKSNDVMTGRFSQHVLI